MTVARARVACAPNAGVLIAGARNAGVLIAGALAAVALIACGDPPPDDPGPWRRGPELPSVRLEPGVTALADRLVVAGGFGPGLAIVRTVALLDPASGAWSEGPALPVAWTHLQLAAVGDTLYVLGGLEGGQFVARGEAFASTAGAAWRSIAPLPAGHERGGAAVVVDPPRIHLLGGAGTRDALATCWTYDTSTDAWTPLPALPSPRSHPAAMRAPDGTLIVAGGLRTLDATQPIADVVALAPGAPTWQPRAAMPTARGGCAHATLDGQLVCAGGEAGTAALAVVESYDPIADRWSTLASMPEPRAGTQGAALAGALYVPGGAYRLAFQPRATVAVYRE